MASINTTIQCRLAAHARFLLYIASGLAFIGLRLPHRWVVAVTNRSWSMRTGNGPWLPIRIDNSGRIVK
jgi:hypothetical protein